MNKCSYINKKYLRLKQDMEIAEMNKIVRKIDRSQFEEAAYILKALAHETRLCVIMQLTQTEELSVSELREKMDCEQSLLSHHLTDMRAKGILNCRREGKNSFYSIRDKRVTNMLKCMMSCDGSDGSNDISLHGESNRN
ncbi:MAG TPA: helix-turn-helix transcriptional regulator [Fermentimonas caenicola]|jgi:DNA-binding transcriptional ArsR family regulator|nr:metalloregulator ArsR/SmtB family transcription factor [Lascolabacillus sp.]MBP6175323.1 helix-turn-helix transcriptional regulator [Fermentimonas sp.]TAH60586.1 MAG: transcriptional regulator [Fermentimonas caenicola]MBP6196954.1 helix-turn-helix transcriptional regulator [Fermentimonas sp.]MBP7105225.1 helix-turn-helix transcriptional regulator [Fermentimonas sp.]HHU42458.1 helix-turn-helix transcriptional regulator [Fermentimonas caenicola]